MFNKKNLNTNQNLMPGNLLRSYLIQKTIVPALILVVAIILLSSGFYFGMQYYTEYLTETADELKSKDLTKENADAQATLEEKESEKANLEANINDYWNNNPINVYVSDEQVKKLESSLEQLKAEFENLSSQPEDKPVEEPSNRYRIDELLLYIDKIRTQNVIIISLEDENSSSAQGSNHLVYQDDVGNAYFSLHGMATSASDLSKFMTDLNNCEYIASTAIVSIETQSLSNGQNLYVFEITIMPKAI